MSVSIINLRNSECLVRDVKSLTEFFFTKEILEVSSSYKLFIS